MLMILALLSPVFQPYLLNPTLLPFYNCTLLFFLWLLFCFASQQRDVRLAPDHALLLALLLAGWLIASAEFNALTIVSFAAWLVFLAGTLRPFAGFRLLPVAYCIAALLFSLLALIVWSGLTDGAAIRWGRWALTTIEQIKPGGPFGNGNVLAILNVCAWLMVLAAIFRQGASAFRWLLAFVFAFFIAISLSWGAWLAMGSVVLWVVIVLIQRRNNALLVGLLLSLCLAWIAGHWFSLYIHEVNTANNLLDAAHQYGLDDRLTIWVASAFIWLEHPWFGVGIGKMAAHYLSGQSEAIRLLGEAYPEQVLINSAHNSLLQLMAEAGLPGLLLWLSVTGLLLRLCWLYRDRLTSRSWPFIASAWVIWFQGMGNITMSRPYPILVFALFLGVAVAPLLRRRATACIRISKQWLMLVLIVSLPLLAWQSFVHTKNWIDFDHLSYGHDLTDPHVKAEYSARLAEDPTILPYLISGMLADYLLNEKRQENLLKLEPYVQRALTIQQSPLLLKQQFYMHMLQGRWSQACELAHTLEVMKAEQKNRDAYQAVCQHRMPARYLFFEDTNH